MRASNGDRPHVLVHVDELRRDFFVNAALKDVLESRGARVTLTNRSRLRWYLQYGDFDAVIVSQVQMIPFELLDRLAERTDIHMLTTEGALTDEKGVLRTFAKSLEPRCASSQFPAVQSPLPKPLPDASGESVLRVPRTGYRAHYQPAGKRVPQRVEDDPCQSGAVARTSERLVHAPMTVAADAAEHEVTPDMPVV